MPLLFLFMQPVTMAALYGAQARRAAFPRNSLDPQVYRDLA